VSLSRSSAQKLARFLLDWAERHPACASGGVTLALTHEEIAQTIGAARETVTRLLAEMKRRRIIHLKGSLLNIPNRRALETVAAIPGAERATGQSGVR
jgi:CRP/FNR family transcriptional regulator